MAQPTAMLAHIRQEAGETETDFWTDAEILHYMSDAQRKIALIVPCGMDSTSQTTVISQREYTIPSTVGIISRVTYDSDKIKAIDLNQLDSLESLRDGTTQGRSEYYYTLGTTIGLSPVPDATVSLGIIFQKATTDVTSGSTWAIPEWTTDIISDYALYRMFSKDQELSTEALAHKGEWLEGLQGLEHEWNNRRFGDQYVVVKDEYAQPGTELGMR